MRFMLVNSDFECWYWDKIKLLIILMIFITKQLVKILFALLNEIVSNWVKESSKYDMNKII